MKIYRIASALSICAAVFCGCHDKIELNDRAYVNALSVDKSSEKGARFALGVAVSDISEQGSGGGTGETEGKSKSFKKNEGDTITSSVSKLEEDTSQKLFFMQTRAVLFGEELLKSRELFMEAIDAMERNKELSRKTFVLAAENEASEICGLPVTPSVGVFVENFYKDGVNGGSSFKLNLEGLIIKLRSNLNAVIPKISAEDGKIKIRGAAVIGNMELMGFLDETETRGYLWQHETTKGATILALYDGYHVPYKIMTHKKDISFYEAEEGLNMRVNVYTTGAVTEYAFGALLNEEQTVYAIERQVEEAIKKEINKSNEKLQKQFKSDAADTLSILKRRNYKLWQKYSGSWKDVFVEMPVDVHVEAKVKSMGSIK